MRATHSDWLANSLNCISQTDLNASDAHLRGISFLVYMRPTFSGGTGRRRGSTSVGPSAFARDGLSTVAPPPAFPLSVF